MNEQLLTRAHADIERQDELRRLQLNALTKPRSCRLCGARVHPADSGQARTVCQPCGGLRKQRELEAEDARRAKHLRRQERLLQIAGVSPTTTQETTMEERKCSKCGKKLGANNTTGVCTSCQRGSYATAKAAREGRSNGSVRRQFRTVAEALGQDPDELLERFMSGWLDRLKSTVRLEEN